MELHQTSIYQCPGCLTTYTGAELTETLGNGSLVRTTPCCGSVPLLVTPRTLQKLAADALGKSA